MKPNELGKHNKPDVLKLIAKGGLSLLGLYAVSNLSIFTSKHFTISGLTREQLDAMDEHNLSHHQGDLLGTFGRGLGAGLSILDSTAAGEMEASAQKHNEENNVSLDNEVANLPGKLKHMH